IREPPPGVSGGVVGRHLRFVRPSLDRTTRLQSTRDDHLGSGPYGAVAEAGLEGRWGDHAPCVGRWVEGRAVAEDVSGSGRSTEAAPVDDVSARPHRAVVGA